MSIENYLNQIKILLRTGNKPLQQVAKRVYEMSRENFCVKASSRISIRYKIDIYIKYNFILSTKKNDNWFSTQKMKYFK